MQRGACRFTGGYKSGNIIGGDCMMEFQLSLSRKLGESVSASSVVEGLWRHMDRVRNNEYLDLALDLASDLKLNLALDLGAWGLKSWRLQTGMDH